MSHRRWVSGFYRRSRSHFPGDGALEHAKNITLTAVAKIFDVWPNIISRLERGLYRNDAMADQYREWLTAA